MKRCLHRLSEQLSQDLLPGSDDLPAANKADLGIATVEAVLVRRRREIAAWGHDPRRTGHKAFARLGEGLHANSRNAVDRYRHAVMRDHVSRDSIDLLSKHPWPGRSEEHTSELQSLMRISYAVFCLKKKKRTQQNY